MSFKADEMRLLHDKIVVRRLDTHQEGLIIAPSNAREVGNSAEVVCVGPGLKKDGERIPMELKVGDEVLIGPYAGTEMYLDDGSVCLNMREPDVLGIVIR